MEYIYIYITFWNVGDDLLSCAHPFTCWHSSLFSNANVCAQHIPHSLRSLGFLSECARRCSSLIAGFPLFGAPRLSGCCYGDCHWTRPYPLPQMYTILVYFLIFHIYIYIYICIVICVHIHIYIFVNNQNNIHISTYTYKKYIHIHI